MFNRLSGATRLFPIIGDPIKYVESPTRLTRTFGQRDYNGICVPLQVLADDLDTVMAGLTASRNVDGILVTMPHKFTAFAHCTTSSERAKMLGVVSVIAALLTSSMFVGDVIAGHGVTPFLEAAEAAGCKTANGGHMVEADQDVMADFMLRAADETSPT
jgi:shikimate 5-dehydrogenase